MTDQYFGQILSVVIAVSMIIQIIVIIQAVFRADEGVERYARAMAFITGVLIFLGCYKLNITFADLMFAAITEESTLKLATLSCIIPFAVGVIVTHLTIKALKKESQIAIRVMILIGTLTLGQVLYTYFVAFIQESMSYSKALTPNMCYCIGIGIWVVFNLKPETTQRSRY